MRGWVEATERSTAGYQNALENPLDAKVRQVFGKKMQWGDLFTMGARCLRLPSHSGTEVKEAMN